MFFHRERGNESKTQKMWNKREKYIRELTSIIYQIEELIHKIDSYYETL